MITLTGDVVNRYKDNGVSLESTQEVVLNQPIVFNLNDWGKKLKINWSYRFFLSSFGVYLPELKNTLRLFVADGFVYDGASMRQALWSLLGHPLYGRHFLPALLHDILYATELFSRWQCDWIFLCYMKEQKVCWIKRNVMWFAVRCFGWLVWRKHTYESKVTARFLIRLEYVDERIGPEDQALCTL